MRIIRIIGRIIAVMSTAPLMKRVFIGMWQLLRYSAIMLAMLTWVMMALGLLALSVPMRSNRQALRTFAHDAMLAPLIAHLKGTTPAPSPAPATTPEPDPAPAPASTTGRHRRPPITPTPATARRRAAGQGGSHQRPSTTPPPAPAPRTGANPWPPTGQLVSTQEIIALLAQTTN